MFFRRGVRADRWLHAKITLFSVGALVAVVGMAMRNDWVIGVAGLILAAGVLLRFVPRRDADQAPGDGRPEAPEEAGAAPETRRR